jgi:hypothetical protein
MTYDEAAPPPPAHNGNLTPIRSRRNWFIAALTVALVVAGGAGVVLIRHFVAKPSGGEVILTAATDPGTNAFMPPAAAPPPTGTQPPTSLSAKGNGSTVETQPLPGDRDGLYGGTVNTAGIDRGKMSDFLAGHPVQAGAFVDALNADPTVYWSGGRRLVAADAATYLGELTPAVLRLDTRITNHGFDGAHPTAVQSIFQTGTSVLVDAHGVPRVRGLSGNPLTVPIALSGAPKFVGAPWTGYRPGGLAEVLPAAAAITTFVLVDIVDGQPFNRPVGTNGTGDTPHTQPVAAPGSASTDTQQTQLSIVGTYLRHTVTYECNGQNHLAEAQAQDGPFTVALQGNTVTLYGHSGSLNPDGSFMVEGPNGPTDHISWQGVFATEGGRNVMRDVVMDDRYCHSTWTATKQ